MAEQVEVLEDHADSAPLPARFGFPDLVQAVAAPFVAEELAGPAR